MKTYLPEAFINRMKDMLGEEAEDFLSSYQKERKYGLRVNTLKITCEEFEAICPFPIKKIPWIPNGYFYPSQVRPAAHPYYKAGLYYLQEPSAMTPAACLPILPGEAVLDLCAAPGGKATELAARLKGQGVLVANDISTSRSRALLRNLELFGASNILVSNETPERLAGYFPEFFHKILLDAPCSGEGMFRKDENLARDWSMEKSQNLAQIQRKLILLAADMLQPGGMLLYSTCTFAPDENEKTIAYLLEQRPSMTLSPLPKLPEFSPGNPAWGDHNPDLAQCVRLWPHKMDGEGHFMALLKKEGETRPLHVKNPKTKIDAGSRKLLEDFAKNLSQNWDWSGIEVRGQKAYTLLPMRQNSLKGLHFLRSGLYLGDLLKNRFEPSQPLALSLGKDGFLAKIHLSPEDERIPRYLSGEPILLEPQELPSSKGWHLLCAGDYPLGWGKLVGNTLKNKYPSGWRS